MIKASSLFYALVISLLIAIVSSSLILYASLSRIEFESFEMNQRIHLNAKSGLQLLMSNQSIVNLNQQKTIDLYGIGEDSVFLERKSWGAYELAISKARFRNSKVSLMAMLGYYPDSLNRYSIYLADHDKPLALCGKTIIKGIAFLPKAGVKRAYIEGQSFVGNKLIEGEIRQSKSSLPPFNQELVQLIENIQNQKNISFNDSLISIEKDLSGDNLENSFENPSLVIYGTNSIRISNGSYKGNIAIISDKEIVVAESARLNYLILAAPKIIFESNFKGNVQAFARDSIILRENVSLAYPSVLGLIKNNSVQKIAAIQFGENDSLSGAIFACNNQSAAESNVIVNLSKQSVVVGQVYSSGYVDLKGKVIGSVMSNKVMLNTPSSVYENHLLNSEISSEDLSKHYVGINLLQEFRVKKIVKWIN